jgi:hypothetical protein
VLSDGVYVVLRELTVAACFLRFASRALSRWLPRAIVSVFISLRGGYRGLVGW